MEARVMLVCSEFEPQTSCTTMSNKTEHALERLTELATVRQTDGQTDIETDIETDGQSDRQNIYCQGAGSPNYSWREGRKCGVPLPL